ncbi:MAG: hypothetical protein JO276_08730 [Sphingomonadaceae bacterium]|nr:hypothetical protein [Sphingomonadaceae bacterium]
MSRESNAEITATEDELQGDALLARARKEFARCRDAWRQNQEEAREDLRFARLGDQWPAAMALQRKIENRPCLTFNKMPAFIRQVVNDARQNKPSVKVHPQDSGADKRVAEIFDGLIRNIETASDADVATDTAIEHAVGQGFGFWRYNLVYASDDAFEKDIVVERVANPFTIYGDPRSTAADSSDWDVAFIVTTLGKDEFEREYPDAEKVDWDHDFRDCPDWLDGEDVTVAEYWTREKVRSAIVALSDGTVERLEEVERRAEELLAAGIGIVGAPRETESWKVTQRIISGAEILKTVDWAGKYIPIVPVYGDEVIDEDGKRWFRSLIRDAKAAQQMFNYWRTTTTELVALAPKAPWIGEEGAFDADRNWESANSTSHAKLEYAKGSPPPQRQPFSGVPAGALQEAMNASDDMKAITGIYDASLGARSNETSGRAILARQREGDVSTFHFIDNLSRAIRHGGRILLDLIPKVYGTERIVRILGEDLAPAAVKVAPTGQPVTEQTDEAGRIVSRIYDLGAGKYDLTVSSGPSFTTRREEAALQMEAFIQKVPQAAPLIGDLYAEALDWPLADRIGERLKLLLPPQLQEGGGPPLVPPQLLQQIQQGMQVIQQQGQQLQQAQQRIHALEQGAALKGRELELKARSLEIKGFEAETARIEAERGTLAKVAAVAPGVELAARAAGQG